MKFHTNNKSLNKLESFLKEIITGEFLNKNFILRQIKVFALAIVLVFVYMNNRMICERSYKEIHNLRKELVNEKHYALMSESYLLSISRIGTIKDLVKKHNLPLVEETQPAYKVTIQKTEEEWIGFHIYG